MHEITEIKMTKINCNQIFVEENYFLLLVNEEFWKICNDDNLILEKSENLTKNEEYIYLKWIWIFISKYSRKLWKTYWRLQGKSFKI